MVNKWRTPTLTDVEEIKLAIGMLPIWATTVMYWTIYIQMCTFSIGLPSHHHHEAPHRQIFPDCSSFPQPSARSSLLTVPVYDWIVLPITRKSLNNPQGLTPLQRIDVGLVLSIFSMVAAALAEVKRLRVARSHGLANNPTTTVVPLSVFWLIPQFFFAGSDQTFIYNGQLDFFLRECPPGMKSMSTGLFLSTIFIRVFP